MTAAFDSMEVTQAIQYKDHPPHLDNSVPLVAAKGTTVRVYMKGVPIGCTGSVANVGGILTIRQIGVATGFSLNVYVADNGVITVRGEETNAVRRADSAKTLNYSFVAPSTGALDSILLELQFRQYGSESGSVPTQLPFFDTDIGTRLAGIRTRFSGARGAFEPSTAQIKEGVADRMYWSVWPVHAPRGPHGAGGGAGLPSYQLYDDPILPFDIVWGLAQGGQPTFVPFGDALQLIDLVRLVFIQPQPDFLVAWVGNGTPVDPVLDNPNPPLGPAFGTRGVSCGAIKPRCFSAMIRDDPSFHQGTFAHEPAHNYLNLGSPMHDLGTDTIAPEFGWDVGFSGGYLGLGNLKPPSRRNLALMTFL